MNSITMPMIPDQGLGLRARIQEAMGQSRDRTLRHLFKEILSALDRPCDFTWMREEFKLSATEYKVVELLFSGKTPREISDVTGTAYSTVRAHIHSIYKKARVNSLPELVSLITQKPAGDLIL